MQGHMIARDGQLDTSLVPPFPQGFYLISISFADRNSTNSEYVGTAKFYLQAMEQIKTKKRPKA